MDLKNQTQKRTIKFRAIKDDMSDFRFVYGNLIYDHKGNPRIQEDANEPTFTTCVKGSECQFTGLTDKNGKEIYEGDKTSYGVIMWNSEKALFAEHFYQEAIQKWSVSSYPISVDRMEIIGNIYEQPK